MRGDASSRQSCAFAVGFWLRGARHTEPWTDLALAAGLTEPAVVSLDLLFQVLWLRKAAGIPFVHDLGFVDIGAYRKWFSRESAYCYRNSSLLHMNGSCFWASTTSAANLW
jgi:hypothetical protein